MQLLVGLGNPGSEYHGTRHNIGFDVVDAVARHLHQTFVPGDGEFVVAHATWSDHPVVLLKPLTYMNNSGTAVAEVQGMLDIPFDRILVVCDDFQLPLGTLRLRRSGSDGGHNGLYSIIDHMHTDAIPRLRCGIASAAMPGARDHFRDFVLEPFLRDELPTVRAMVDRARDACLSFVAEGIEAAMNRFNQSPPQP